MKHFPGSSPCPGCSECPECKHMIHEGRWYHHAVTCSKWDRRKAPAPFMVTYTFEIYAQGDPTVGDGALTATVTIPHMWDEAGVAKATEESLREAFVTIFDTKRVQISLTKTREG